jgi:hypothetical protein
MKNQTAEVLSLTAHERETFYRGVLNQLNESAIPYLVGGGYALEIYAGIGRSIKDLDLFARPAHVQLILDKFANKPYRSELSFPHWLGKIFGRRDFIDVIFSSGNGLCAVDDGWFEHAPHGKFLGIQVRFCPPEEMIWSKTFVMERERYDGADVAHLIRACGARMDWRRLLDRFGPHWRVLLSHLILFEYIYPGENSVIPSWVSKELFERLRQEKVTPDSPNRICRGTLLSRAQFRGDVEFEGYKDARQAPLGPMTEEEAYNWTAAAKD